MANNSFYTLFLELLREIFDSEQRQIEAFPDLIKATAHSKLRDALKEHLQESKEQLGRLKKIFSALNENPLGAPAKNIQDLLQDCRDVTKKDLSNSVKDAYLIISLQKVDHYEIACYGSARAIARHLSSSSSTERVDFDDIADNLQLCVDEERDNDERLTEIAEGGFFTLGINEEAEKEEPTKKR